MEHFTVHFNPGNFILTKKKQFPFSVQSSVSQCKRVTNFWHCLLTLWCMSWTITLSPSPSPSPSPISALSGYCNFASLRCNKFWWSPSVRWSLISDVHGQTNTSIISYDTCLTISSFRHRFNFDKVVGQRHYRNLTTKNCKITVNPNLYLGVVEAVCDIALACMSKAVAPCTNSPILQGIIVAIGLCVRTQWRNGSAGVRIKSGKLNSEVSNEEVIINECEVGVLSISNSRKRTELNLSRCEGLENAQSFLQTRKNVDLPQNPVNNVCRYYPGQKKNGHLDYA